MLKLIIGNKAYSSWSLRGWLAVKQSGVPFTEQIVPMWTPAWDVLQSSAEMAPTRGQVPVIWDGDICVWDSLAIITYLSDQAGDAKFWPTDKAARATAAAYCAEMHAGYQALRNACTMNLRKLYPAEPLAEDVAKDVARITHLWETARANYGAAGDFLFGTFGAADIMFAPVVGRFLTYALPTTPVVQGYIDAIRAHPFMQEWQAAADAEEWVIDKYERNQ
jgi:glutathione S-transferase